MYMSIRNPSSTLKLLLKLLTSDIIHPWVRFAAASLASFHADNRRYGGHLGSLTIAAAAVAGTCVLDGTTYMSLRDTISNAVLEHPRAVIVEISELVVVGPSTWAIFPAVRWLITDGPDVSLGMARDKLEGHNALWRNGISRCVPSYWTVDAAITDLTSSRELPY